MKASIDKSKCVMCGSCVAICPEVFAMQDDGSVAVKEKGKVPVEAEEKAVMAQKACPTMAITLEK